MADIESVNTLAGRVVRLAIPIVVSDSYDGEKWDALARLIEADRNAVANAVLDELVALDDGDADTMPVYRAVALLRGKYAAKGGGDEPVVESTP